MKIEASNLEDQVLIQNRALEMRDRVRRFNLTAHALAELTEEAGCPLTYKTTLKFMRDPESVSKYTLKRIDQALNWEENRRERNNWA